MQTGAELVLDLDVLLLIRFESLTLIQLAYRPQVRDDAAKHEVAHKDVGPPSAARSLPPFWQCPRLLVLQDQAVLVCHA